MSNFVGTLNKICDIRRINVQLLETILLDIDITALKCKDPRLQDYVMDAQLITKCILIMLVDTHKN